MRDTMLWALLTDEAGEVAVSFAFWALLIAIFAVVVFSLFGKSTAELFPWIASVIETKG